MQTRVLIEKEGISPAFAIDDRIVLGEGLFETIKVERSHPCFAHLHWLRLGNSAKILGIPFDLLFDEWLEHLIQQIRRDNLYHGGIKAILSGGPAPRGLAQQGQTSHLLLQSFNYTMSTHPLHLISASWLRDRANPIYQLKSVNYLEAILASRKALECGADDALFFNTHHYATETTCANLFFIKNDTLYTPALTEGVLPGITRSRILKQCVEQHISCVETSVSKKMIEEADAVFITNCLQGIRSVLFLDDTPLGAQQTLVEHLISLLDQEEA